MVIYKGRPCVKCGSTDRSLATNRCHPCNLRYGLNHRKTNGERNAMRGQPCTVCMQSMIQPCYDEDPVTNRFRGWLCHHCNLALGHIHEDPQIAESLAIYLSLMSADKKYAC